MKSLFSLVPAQLTQSPDGYLWAGGADSTTILGIDKDVFEDGIAEGVNNENPLKDIISFQKVDYKGGLGHVFTRHVGRNVSPFFGAEDAAFPEAGAQRHLQGRVTVKKMYARVRLTAEAMDDTQSSEGAWKSAKKDEMQRIIDDIAKREEFSLSCDGRGVLCLLNGSATAAVWPVDSPGNIAGADFGNRFAQVNMFIGAINPANGSLRTSIRKVVSNATAGTSITFDSSTFTGWADNDYLVQVANSAVTDVLDTSYEQAYWGLPAMIDDGTNRAVAYGIQRSLDPSFSSYVLSSAGAMSTDAMQRTSDVVYQKLGGEINLLLMHPSVRREFIKLTEADVRYGPRAKSSLNSNPGTVAFGKNPAQAGAMDLGDADVRGIRTLGLGQIYFLDTKRAGLKQYVAEPGRFIDEDGAVLVRDGIGTTARHAFEAWWYARKQNFLAGPGFCARWDGVTGQTLVVVPEL